MTFSLKQLVIFFCTANHYRLLHSVIKNMNNGIFLNYTHKNELFSILVFTSLE